MRQAIAINNILPSDTFFRINQDGKLGTGCLNNAAWYVFCGGRSLKVVSSITIFINLRAGLDFGDTLESFHAGHRLIKMGSWEPDA